MKEVRQFHHLGGAHHHLVVLGLRHLSHLEREADVLVDGHGRVEPVALEHHGDVAVLGRQIVDHFVANPDLAFGEIFETRDHAHRGRLAASRGAQQNEEFGVCDFKVERLDPDEIAPTLRYVA